MDTRTVFFIGKPGCGKGDQAKLLSATTGWPVFSSGGLFRAIAKEDSPVGRKVKEENYAGILQPHWFAMYLFLKTLFSIPEGSGAIFDGFSRKIPEAELVIDAMRWLNRPFVVLYLRVSDDEIKHRIALRKEAEGRADDTFVDKRLEEYRTHTEPCIQKFRETGNLIEVDGERSREAIAEDIRAKLGIK
ncbi:nucleoside monophosphate kinase [Candidatus Kaiserbacteria bacterium]|nr:nucleoside monophosphate kinase [Candidatus Kaiserbacteria bacterium]